MYKTILCASDLGDNAQIVLSKAAELAQATGAHVHLLHVLELPWRADPWFTPYIQQDVDFFLNLAQRQQEAAKTQLENLWKDVSSSTTHGKPIACEYIIREGVPADTIIAASQETQSDMIVMGTHGRHGLSHFLLGSVAERVVRTATCCVLTIRTPTQHA